MSILNREKYGEHGERLKNVILSDKLSHAYIVTGDSLTDKIGFSLDLAKAALCREKPGEGCDVCSICRRIDGGNYEDLYRVYCDDASVKDSDISSLQQNLFNRPSAEGKKNIAIVEGADRMTVRAQNRFLKTLEEPPADSLILLLADNSETLIPTIKSRCISIRLPNTESMDEEGKQYLEFAEEIIKSALEGEYFFSIKERLDTVKDRNKALSLLDAMERLFRNYMLKDDSRIMDRRTALKAVGFVEEARKDIAYNVNPKYALRNLILKIGG